MPVKVWHITVDVSDLWSKFEELGLEEAARQVAARIRESGWRGITPYPNYFDDLVAYLEKPDNLGDFNARWDELYDLADSDRVWLNTF